MRDARVATEVLGGDHPRTIAYQGNIALIASRADENGNTSEPGPPLLAT